MRQVLNAIAFANGNGMSKVSKLSLVFGGYAAAFLGAATASYALAWVGKSQGTSGGMQAFGDLLGFLAIFGVLALAPTALALYFLRPVEKFWSLLSIASLALAATGVVAAILIGSPHWSQWAILAVGFFGLLLVLGAPLLGIGFLVCAAIAPRPHSRWLLLASSGIEFCVGAYVFLSLFIVGHWIR
jgi:hypothetical protein